MNYRDAGIYTNRSTIELKTEFEEILEALEAIGQKQEITIELLDFWLNGSILTNYDIWLGRLNVEKLLKDSGVPKEHLKNVLQDNSLDRYVLFKNACLSFIGEELTADFKTLILDPIDKLYTKPHEEGLKHKAKQLSNARDSIKKLKPSITKAIKELQAIEPYVIAGTFEENIFIKLQQIEHLLINQIEVD